MVCARWHQRRCAIIQTAIMNLTMDRRASAVVAAHIRISGRLGISQDAARVASTLAVMKPGPRTGDGASSRYRMIRRGEIRDGPLRLSRSGSQSDPFNNAGWPASGFVMMRSVLKVVSSD
jgi:hypothetical protein